MMTIIGAFVLGSGSLFRGNSLSLNGILVIIMLALAVGHYCWFFHIKRTVSKSLATELEWPLLLVVIVWTIFRLGDSFVPNLIVFPAITIAWITTRYHKTIFLICFLVGVAVEAGLVLTGSQTLFFALGNIVICLIVAGSLNLFPGSKLYKLKLRQNKTDNDRDNATQEQSVEMGLAADNISTAEILRNFNNIDTATSFSQQTVESINKSFELQLEMVRLSLDLTTIAVLWPGPANDDLRLRYLATSRKDIIPGPYPLGAGITGALTDNRKEMELIGVKPSHSALPYYRKHEGVGSIMALRIPTGSGGSEEKETVKAGILCVDRESDAPWSDKERQVLRLTGKKLGLEIIGSRQLLNMDKERTTIHRLFHGLRELNSDPSLESIFASSIKAVKSQVPTDLLALCLREEDRHKIVLIEGDGVEALTGQAFPVGEGLVGQVIKTARTLPAKGRYMGEAPIFSNGQTFNDYQSLLVIPLPDEDNTPIGCLVVAAKASHVFTKNRQAVLEVIAGQIAIKVKLGQVHEQLALLATTDGLTGLANHRAFQHGCDAMLERARRRGDHLCLLMADLDHFKDINDNFGHPFGDQILLKVAGIMAETVRVVDLVARYGGEEFAIVLENCDARGGWTMAERIRERIEELTLTCEGKHLALTISIGIAVFPTNCEDKTELIELADQALYRAKNEGRNRTIMWSGTNR